MPIAKKSYMNLFIFLFLFAFSLQAQEKWVQTAKSSSFNPRYMHTSIEFKNKLWIFGGRGNASDKIETICSSVDGVTWKVEAKTGPWTSFAGHIGHTSVVFDGKVWVIGGGDKPQVWSSIDGINWTFVKSNVPFVCNHTSVVYDNKIWIIGGDDVYEASSVNKVWYSSDGANWILATNAAPWTKRSSHASVVYNNKMWIIGGRNDRLSDVWSSKNGVDWTLETIAPWSARYDHSVVVYKGKIWLMGGALRNTMSIDDIWSSKDGVNWTLETRHAPWGYRMDHTTTIFKNKIWLIAGRKGTYEQNDVWCLEPTISISKTIKFYIPIINYGSPVDIDFAFPSQQNNLHVVANWETKNTLTVDAFGVSSNKKTSPIILDTSKISKDGRIRLNGSYEGIVKNITIEISGYDNFPDYIRFTPILFGEKLKYSASFPVPANSVKFIRDYPNSIIFDEKITADKKCWQIELIDRSPFSNSGIWMWAFKK